MQAGVEIQFRITKSQKPGKFERGGYLLRLSEPPTQAPQKNWHLVTYPRKETEYWALLTGYTEHQLQERSVT